jgi:hypothetical protein
MQGNFSGLIGQIVKGAVSQGVPERIEMRAKIVGWSVESTGSFSNTKLFGIAVEGEFKNRIVVFVLGNVLTFEGEGV